jgi:hypothetical protein
VIFTDVQRRPVSLGGIDGAGRRGDSPRRNRLNTCLLIGWVASCTSPRCYFQMKGNIVADSDFDLQAERDRLAGEVARLRAERISGVPAELLMQATTEDDAVALAHRLLEWRGPAAAPPSPVANKAPFYPVSQFSRDSLGGLTAEQINEAYRQGRLEQIGAPAPQPHNGRP